MRCETQSAVQTKAVVPSEEVAVAVALVALEAEASAVAEAVQDKPKQ